MEIQLPKWYTTAKAEGRIKQTNPSETSFSFREWVWGILAYVRFWNKQFQSPYRGLPMRKALILMRLRDERPLSVEEIMMANQPNEGGPK